MSLHDENALYSPCYNGSQNTLTPQIPTICHMPQDHEKV